MRKIPVADYLVEFFIANGVTDVFGYQGGMVCHIFDSLGIYKDKINYHSCGNEQGAAFAACGYAQATGKLGVVITTSGPGFTNALTGIANAWFDSVPVMLISGQVNTKDKRRDYTFRQFGFQEIQAVPMAEPIVKKAYDLDLGMDYIALLDEAYKIAFTGRKGPVYLDFPINVEREIVEVDDVIAPVELETSAPFDASSYIAQLMAAKKPIIIAGGGIKQLGLRDDFRELVNLLRIPVVPTMPGADLIPSDSPYHVGFLGGTARREAGIVLKNTDFVLSLGTRMCNKAIGYNHDDFIPKATKLIRVDLDTTEFERQLKPCEEDVICDLRSFMAGALDYARKIAGTHDHTPWVKALGEMQKLMERVDMTFGNVLVKHFTELMPEKSFITLDVGNNLIYGEQSAVIKSGTRVYESAGLGSMGYSIPAALGIAAGTKTPTYVVTGDGGAQMNIQELNTIAKRHLPVKVLVLNNHVLGHIILFQDHYLDCRRTATTEIGDDYFSCDFVALAKAYGIRSCKVHEITELDQYKGELTDAEPFLIEAEFEDCSMLPNIHGGLDPLTNGPELPEGLAEKVRAIMEA
ncbi:thiamine pyrophosphate-binding protein [Enterocloster clostridioformis]|uniref:Acetolactate synthase I/II/III large subunit n=1 Tax=[Clostridium] clostridioforme 90A8 TaxID=999408 RepID=A0A0E2H9T0_9FIRM|nr:thiamine pyrophosphate-binding protein [Enterocloster clostridioformis]ENZ13526.1 hypothetical protein HMPREF1090_02730 [[Clostridium] clostridioforme 90A8]